VTTDEYRGELGVSTTNPASAWARGTSSYRMTWPEASVRTEATLAVESDEHGFDVTIDLRVWDGDEPIAERRWTRQLPR
jgi:hypothetical protein